MKLSKYMMNKLIEEFDFVIPKMKGTNDISQKLFFFSALYGVANRIMNIEYDEDLAYFHHICQAAFNTINSAKVVAQENPAIIPDGLFLRIEKDLEILRDKIVNGQDFYEILKDISNTAYIATGNGRYLYQKGIIKL